MRGQNAYCVHLFILLSAHHPSFLPSLLPSSPPSAAQFKVEVGSYVLAGSVILSALLLTAFIYCKSTEGRGKRSSKQRQGFQRVPTEDHLEGGEEGHLLFGGGGDRGGRKGRFFDEGHMEGAARLPW